MPAPPPVRATLDACREASNRESRKIAAHRLKAAERVTGRHLSDAMFAAGIRAMLRGHLENDEALCRWLMQQAPVRRNRAVARRAKVTLSDLSPS